MIEPEALVAVSAHHLRRRRCWQPVLKRRPPRPSVSPEAAALLRAAFEPRYGHALADEAVDGIADRFRRLAEVVFSFEQEDRARTALAAAAPPSPPAVPSPPPSPSPSISRFAASRRLAARKRR